jgi:hypothetical protein
MDNNKYVADLWVEPSSGLVKKSNKSPGSGWRMVKTINITGRGPVNDIMSDIVRVIPGGMATATQVMGMGVSSQVIKDLKASPNLEIESAGGIITIRYK